MKKIYSIISVAAVLIATSCAKEEPVNPTNPSEIPDANGIKTVISATYQETRTTVGENGTYKWKSGDAINVFGTDGTSCEEFTTDIAEPAKSADFTGDVPEGVTPQYAVYPYNSDASCTDGVISTVIPTEQDGTIESALSYATSNDGKNFSFNNATSVIKLNFNASDNICGVTVQFAEPVAGNVTLNCANGAISGATSNVVSVTQTDAFNGTIYINVAPTATTNISLTFITLDDQVATLDATVKSGFIAGNIKPLGTVKNLNFSYTLKAFAKEFVKVLDVWRNTVGRVDADPIHNYKNCYTGVHLIPLERGEDPSYIFTGNQHDNTLYPTKFTVKLGNTTYTSAQAWEIAQRGMLDLVTSEGSAELDNFNDSRNHTMTLADGAALYEPVPSCSIGCRWGPAPWYEESAGYKPVTYNGKSITEVGVDFMVKVGAWHVVRSFINTNCNTPLGYIGNYQQFGNSSSFLQLDGYVGLISPVRELLILARFYKYLLDNDINDNVYSEVQDKKFDFDLYGKDLTATLKDFAKEFVGILDLWEVNVVSSQHMVPSGASIKVFGVTYDRAKMFGTAAQGFINLSGDNYDLNGAIPTNLHSNEWSKYPYLENSDPFSVTGGSNAGFDLLKNATNRQINYASGNNNTYANQVDYTKSQVSGYKGYLCLERHLLMLARFYKYLLDNEIDNAQELIGSNAKILDPTLY